MDDAEIKRLREEQFEWAKVLGHADEVMEHGETLLMVAPNNPIVRMLAAVTRWVHRRAVEGEAKARDEARATYWR